jgi:hypothetical protein
VGVVLISMGLIEGAIWKRSSGWSIEVICLVLGVLFIIAAVRQMLRAG